MDQILEWIRTVMLSNQALLQFLTLLGSTAILIYLPLIIFCLIAHIINSILLCYTPTQGDIARFMGVISHALNTLENQSFVIFIVMMIVTPWRLIKCMLLPNMLLRQFPKN